MGNAVGMSCTLGDGCTWPRCIGPNGCMKDKPTPLVVAVKPTSQLPIWSPRNIKLKEKEKKKKEKKKIKPKALSSEYVGKDRRSISVSRTTYDQMKKVSMAMNVSMAGILEDECNRFFSKKG